MKIAINCAFFQPKGGGIKEYVFNLVENLNEIAPNDWDIILYVLEDYYEFALSHLQCRFRIKKIPFKGNGLFNTIVRSCMESLFWRKEEKREKWDLFHSPFFHTPRLKNTKIILTVHDMRFYRYPKTYTFLRYTFLKYAVKQSVKRADFIISISDFTKKEIVSAYNIPPKKIQVIHEAINPNHFSHSVALSKDDIDIISNIHDKKFILTVGHLEPRKNYNRLIDAVELLNENLSDKVKLVIVGKQGHDYEETLKKIAKSENVFYLNFVSQELLNWLYENTALFVFPTFYEGFGFPPLEAAMHNTISAVSNISSIPEICGDCALYFDPFNIKEMAHTIHEGLFNDECRKNLTLKLPTQLSKFSWKKNAEETILLYESIFRKTSS